MIHRTTLAAALLAAFIVMPSCRAADAVGCTQQVVASFDLDMERFGRMRVPVTMNHQSFKMLIDTGSFVTTISQRTTKVLGLKSSVIPGKVTIMGGNGRQMNSYVALDQFTLGGLEAGKTQLIVDPRNLADYDGLFGENFLSNYDLDFDFAKGKLNFINAQNCNDGAVYWTKGSYGEVPFSFNDHDIEVQVVLDGKPVTATLDTGSFHTTMNLERASILFGLAEGKFPGGRGVKAFETLSFGDVTVKNPVVTLVSTKMIPVLSGSKRPMVVGMNVLRKLHVYISHKRHMIYVTPANQY
jgi:predicted aspartyl protease